MAQLGDDKAASGAYDEQSALLQPLQRLPHRSPADAHIARNLLLAHAHTAPNAAVPDRIAKTFEDKVSARPGAQHGLVKNREHKIHPDLVDWEHLNPDSREENRKQVRFIPSILAEIDQVASRQFQAVSSLATRWTAPSIG